MVNECHDAGALASAIGPRPPVQGAWFFILCLVGLDYFSTLAYVPSIAFESAGLLAPFAILVVCAVTVLAVLPTYAYVAGRAPPGRGATGLLAQSLRGWPSKIIILIVLGFVAADFVITRTISAADAAEHVLCNATFQPILDWLDRLDDLIRPHLPAAVASFLLGSWSQRVALALVLSILSFSFWAFMRRGLTRGILRLVVGVTSLYVALTTTILIAGAVHLASHPATLAQWLEQVRRGAWQIAAPGHDAWSLVIVCLFAFPSVSVGLSGFELCMAVVPFIRGPDRRAQVAGTRKLLVTAAIVMSLLLIGSVLVTSVLVPAASFGGAAHNRALAYLAHGGLLADGTPALASWFGTAFGTIYDLSTVLILCLAGSSVTLGLRRLVPHFLAQFGMQLKWAQNVGLIFHLFNVINLVIIVIFHASVGAQRGAYATSVLMLLATAAAAAAFDRWRAGDRGPLRAPLSAGFALVAVLLLIAAGEEIVRNPAGLLTALWFVFAVLATSFASRMLRSTELRFVGFDFADAGSRELWQMLKPLPFPVLVPHRPGRRTLASKEHEIRAAHRLAANEPVVFLEVLVGDASNFYHRPLIEAGREDGRIVLHITRCASIAHTIAAVALELSRESTPPEIHFGWSDENPLAANLRFVLFGEGNIPWMVRELIRRAEPDARRQPRIIMG
ncbi:MAG: amino acid transporter [Planctomycetota bacterium]